MKPFLSVVIPCYNHGEYLDQCIESVLSSPKTYLYEVIIINDGSTDALTIQKLNSLEHPLVRVIHQENKGLTASRNLGIKNASANLILNLDSDNYIDPLFIPTAVKFFLDNPQIDIFYTDKIEFDNDSKRKKKINVEEFHVKKLLLYNFIDSCAVFRKSIWEKAGGYDLNFSVFEDWEFWISCVEKGANFYHFKKAMFFYRISPSSMIHAANENQRKVAVKLILEKHLELYANHINEIGFSLRYTLNKPFLHLVRVLFRRPFLLSQHN